VASNDILPNEAALADLPKVSTVYPDRSSTAVAYLVLLWQLAGHCLFSLVLALVLLEQLMGFLNKMFNQEGTDGY
jgi:hypothetical protein